MVRAGWMLAAAVLTCAAAAAQTMTAQDVVRLKEEGIGEAVIMAQIEATGTRFHLTTDEIVSLKRAGASDDLLMTMIKGPGTTTPAPAPTPAPASDHSAPAPPAYREMEGGVDLYPGASGPRGRVTVHLEDIGSKGPATRIKDPAAERLMLRLVAGEGPQRREYPIGSVQRDGEDELVLEHPSALTVLLPPGEHRLRLELVGVPFGSETPQMLAEGDAPPVEVGAGSEGAVRFLLSHKGGALRGEEWRIGVGGP